MINCWPKTKKIIDQTLSIQLILWSEYLLKIIMAGLHFTIMNWTINFSIPSCHTLRSQTTYFMKSLVFLLLWSFTQSSRLPHRDLHLSPYLFTHLRTAPQHNSRFLAWVNKIHTINEVIDRIDPSRKYLFVQMPKCYQKKNNNNKKLTNAARNWRLLCILT